MLIANIVFAQNAKKVDGNDSNKLSQLKNGIVFIENKGQIHDTEGNPREDILYVADLGNLRVYFKQDGISYVLHKFEKNEEGKINRDNVRTFRFDVDILNSDANVAARNVQKGYYNHLGKGKNITRIRTYKKLIYQNVYPHIDLVFHGKNNELKYDVVVKPGGNISDIKFEYKNVELSRSQGNEHLDIVTPLGKLKEEIPSTYEIQRNRSFRKNEINCNYSVVDNQVSFNVGNYDKSNRLIIDPKLTMNIELAYDSDDITGYYPGTTVPYQNNSSGFNFGGGGFTYGDRYICGSTISLDFPDTYDPGGPDHHGRNYDYNWDGFVTKYDQNGNLVWTFLLSGSSDDFAVDIDHAFVNNISWLYIIGSTFSDVPLDYFSPISPNALQGNCTSCTVESDAYIIRIREDARLDSGGTYFGGNNWVIGHRIKVNENTEDVIILGETNSDYMLYTPVNQPCSSCPDYPDAFAASITGDLTTLNWFTYHGGADQENGLGLDINEDGDILITGATKSTSASFPLLNADQTTLNQNGSPSYFDVFIASFDGTTGVLQYSSYFGGEDDDFGQDVSYVNDQEIAIAGFTKSANDEQFMLMPLYNIPPDYNGGTGDNGDGFFSFMQETPSGGYAPDLGTHYVGGTGVDRINDLQYAEVSGNGYRKLLMTGFTDSDDLYMYNAFQDEINNGLTLNEDALVVSINTHAAGVAKEAADLDIISYYDNSYAVDNKGFGIDFYKDASTNYFTIAGNYQQEIQKDVYISEFKHINRLPTYVGGTNFDGANDLHVDDDDYIYLTGKSYSQDYPTTSGVIQESKYSANEIIVSKFDAYGEHRFSTYYGGGANEQGNAIYAKNHLSDIFITGDADGDSDLEYNDANHVTPQPFTQGLYTDAFFMKLSYDGTALRYFTYWGDAHPEVGEDIAVDDSNNAYITGVSGSFITMHNAYQSTFGGGTEDAFVVRYYSDGSIAWDTYLGGSDNESGMGITYLNNRSEVAVTGYTASTDFPISIVGTEFVNPIGLTDAFLTIFSDDGTFQYSSYAGGSDKDTAHAISNSYGDTLFVAGVTYSDVKSSFKPDMNPDTNHVYGGDPDGFIFKFYNNNNIWYPANGPYNGYSVYINGDNEDRALAITNDNEGNVFVAGVTNSEYGIYFGGKEGFNYYQDAFLQRYNTKLELLSRKGTYYGGDNDEKANGVGVDHLDRPVIGGTTYSNDIHVDLVYPFDGTYNSDGDIFIAKFESDGSDYIKQSTDQTIELPELTSDGNFKDNANIYPNPTENYLHIENIFQGRGNLSIKISSISGVILLSYNHSVSPGNYKRTIDLTNLSAGVYTIQLRFKEDYFVRQFVKTK